MGPMVLSEQEWEAVKGHIEGCAIEHDGEYSGSLCLRHDRVWVDRTAKQSRCAALCAGCGHDCTSHVALDEGGLDICVADGCQCLHFTEVKP